MTQNKKSPGENQWLQDPHETREIGSAEVFGSIDFTCDLRIGGVPRVLPCGLGSLRTRIRWFLVPPRAERIINREGEMVARGGIG